MASKRKQKMSFDEGMAFLDDLIEEISGGNLTLEESMKAYEEGAALCAQLEQMLLSHEKRIEQIDLETAEIKGFEG